LQIEVVLQLGCPEGQSPFGGGLGGILQLYKSPKIGGQQGVEKGLINNLFQINILDMCFGYKSRRPQNYNEISC
jgi:hypothetical protein